jgi:hypothetical protein
VCWKFTDVSDVPAVFNTRSLTGLIMKTKSTLETSVIFYHTPWPNNPKSSTFSPPREPKTSPNYITVLEQIERKGLQVYLTMPSSSLRCQLALRAVNLANAFI